MQRWHIVAAACLLAGCAEPPPYESSPPRYEAYPAPQARTGGHVQVRPLGMGALAGAQVEAYMDRQEGELRAKLRFAGVIVSRIGDDLAVNLRSDFLFGANADTLSPRGSDVLEALADVARKYDSTALAVNAFTDTSGTPARNLAVSQRRAATVARALALDGVDPRRIQARGFGDSVLAIPTGAGVAETRNRRIEIRLVPLVKG